MKERPRKLHLQHTTADGRSIRFALPVCAVPCLFRVMQAQATQAGGLSDALDYSVPAGATFTYEAQAEFGLLSAIWHLGGIFSNNQQQAARSTAEALNATGLLDQSIGSYTRIPFWSGEGKLLRLQFRTLVAWPTLRELKLFVDRTINADSPLMVDETTVAIRMVSMPIVGAQPPAPVSADSYEEQSTNTAGTRDEAKSIGDQINASLTGFGLPSIQTLAIGGVVFFVGLELLDFAKSGRRK